MGYCGGKDNAEKEHSKQLDKQLKEDAEKSARESKLLLLGARGSGKSTVLWQVTNTYDKSGCQKESRKKFINVILNNALLSLSNILQAMKTITPNVEFADSVRKSDAEIFLSYELLDTTATSLPDGAPKIMKDLWADAGVQQCYQRLKGYQLMDSAKYYLDSLDRICEPNFIPDEQDVLRCSVQRTNRVPTPGIVEEYFSHKDLSFRIIDVRSQQSDRRKWIHCFEGVTAIIFCASLNAYDLVSAEDSTTNRMHESMKLFDSVCNDQWLTNKSLILFLNKKDLFEEKITRSSLKICFPEYRGADEYAEAAQYIRGKFEDLNRNEMKEIYTHFTCATDTQFKTKFFEPLMDSVIDIIIKDNLRVTGRF